MKKNLKTIVVCSLISTDNIKTVGNEVFCVNCIKKIWLSDSTLKAVKEGNPTIDIDKHHIQPMCHHCGFFEIERTDAEVVLPTKDQMEEIRNLFDG